MNFLRYEKQVQLNRLDKWPSSRVIAHYLYDKSGFKPLSRKKFIKGYLRYYAGKSQGE